MLMENQRKQQLEKVTLPMPIEESQLSSGESQDANEEFGVQVAQDEVLAGLIQSSEDPVHSTPNQGESKNMSRKQSHSQTSVMSAQIDTLSVLF
jgi:hypothetical protein